MLRELRFTPTADAQLGDLERNPAKKGVLKQVRKALGYLETDTEHRSLKTHEYHIFTRDYGIKVYGAYAQRKTPAAYRVFFHYGPDEITNSGKRIPIITIVAITPHP